MDELPADMGKYVVAESPNVLISLGLGSCIGCAIYDPEKKVGGLAHVMLPKSRECVRPGQEHQNMNKFADIAIPAMVDELIKKKHCDVKKLKAKIAGGGHMFKGLIESEELNIGKRNAESVIEQLKILGIPIIANETGGDVGRTVRFFLETGIMNIKTKDGRKDI